MDFRDHSIAELVKKVKNKEISAKELTESALSNIEKYDAAINAFCALNTEDAIKQAETLDKKISDGEAANATVSARAERGARAEARRRRRFWRRALGRV